MEHGLKYITLYVKRKHIAPRAICYNHPLVRDKPPGAPTYRETRLLANQLWGRIHSDFPMVFWGTTRKRLVSQMRVHMREGPYETCRAPASTSRVVALWWL